MMIRKTDVGLIGIDAEQGHVTRVLFERELAPSSNAESSASSKATARFAADSALIVEAFAQLDAYLAGTLRVFTLPLKATGTPFMEAVWAAIGAVPYGFTVTYGALAARIGRPKASRAVGLACNRNPVPLFIPCHRIVGANGKLVGFGGGLPIKEQLLGLEAARVLRA